jgi:uncharacterized lipoprotein NlpE involved in copper resistance
MILIVIHYFQNKSNMNKKSLILSAIAIVLLTLFGCKNPNSETFVFSEGTLYCTPIKEAKGFFKFNLVVSTRFEGDKKYSITLLDQRGDDMISKSIYTPKTAVSIPIAITLNENVKNLYYKYSIEIQGKQYISEPHFIKL